MANIDINDTPFVAMATHLNAKLWTGDKQLYNGLKEIGLHLSFNTNEILGLL